MQAPARSLKFCGAWAQFACMILAHAATRVTFHVYFLVYLYQTIQCKLFQELRVHLSRLVEQCLNGYFEV